MNEKPNSDPNGTRFDWSDVLQTHQRWLRTVIAARCGEAQAVDEIMQEVAYAVVRQRAPLKDPAKIAPWLYQIAVRQSLMYRRKHGRRRTLERRYAERVETQHEHSSSVDPLDWLIAAERRSLVRRGIQNLKPKDAEILLLKYTQDWSYSQISQHLGISESAVESRLHRARQNLRRQMIAFEVIETR